MNRLSVFLLLLFPVISFAQPTASDDVSRRNLIKAVNAGDYKQAVSYLENASWQCSVNYNRKAVFGMAPRDCMYDDPPLNLDRAEAFAHYLERNNITLQRNLFYDATLLQNRGIWYYNNKDYAAAEHLLCYSWFLFNCYGDDSMRAESLYWFGLLKWQTGYYSRAASYCLKALQIQKEILGEHHADNVRVLELLGGIYSTMGDFRQWDTYGLAALESLKSIVGDQSPDYAWLLSNAGITYYLMGDYAEAESYWITALKIFESTPSGKQHPAYADCLSNCGTMYGEKGDDAHAEMYYLKALHAYNNQFPGLYAESPDYKLTLSNLGRVYTRMGKYAEAESKCLEALEKSERLLGKQHPYYAYALYALGELYRTMGKYAEAEPYLLKSLQIRKKIFGEEHAEYAHTLELLGELYADMGDYIAAKTCFNRSMQLTKKRYIQTANYMTEQQRAKFWGTMQQCFYGTYPRFCYRFYAQDSLLSAFNYDNTLFSKGLLLASDQYVRRSILESNDTALINNWSQLVIKKQQILMLQERNPMSPNMAAWQKEAENLEKNLVRTSIVFRQSSERWNVTWDSVRSHLGPNDVAVEFFSAPVNSDSVMYGALLLRHDSPSPEMISLFEAKEILPLVDMTTENRINTTYSAENADNGIKLSDLIWGKLLGKFAADDSIYFSPTGVLYQLPIEFLPYDEQRTVSDVFYMRRLSSTRELAFRSSADFPSQAVLYGGIKYDMSAKNLIAESNKYPDVRSTATRSLDGADRGNITAIPATKIEVENIGRVLLENQMHTRLYTSTNANEESFKDLNGRHQNIIHIATHGFYWPDSAAVRKDYFAVRSISGGPKQNIDPLTRCGLLFAGSQTAWSGRMADIPEGVQDGILTGKEISLLNLRGADLVVLSACETGKGETTGDGVFGLQRAFKQAGVQTIIMSLWKVNDAATQLLMTEFYRNWLNAGQSKHEAFRNAQRAVRRQYPEPVYWAGFIMMD